MQIKKASIRFLVALLTFAIGVIVVLLWVVPRSRTVNIPPAPMVSDTLRDEEISLPEGWMRLDIRGKVTMGVPQDMEPTEPEGDSIAYREAYRNQEIDIVIVYGEIVPRRNEGDRPFDACISRSPIERPTRRESIIDIDGRRAKLSIDRTYQPEFTTARVCFPPNDQGIQLIVVVDCKNDRALETAQQIFTSIRFKDNR